MLIRLYNDNPGETMTEKGIDFDRRITAALSPIIADEVSQNVSLRELETVVRTAASCDIAVACLRKAILSRKQNPSN